MRHKDIIDIPVKCAVVVSGVHKPEDSSFLANMSTCQKLFSLVFPKKQDSKIFGLTSSEVAAV